MRREIALAVQECLPTARAITRRPIPLSLGRDGMSRGEQPERRGRVFLPAPIVPEIEVL